MSFIDEFQANLESLPNILQKKYALIRDLDKSLQGLSFNTLTVCDVIMIQVDTHIQQLDQYLKRFDEELRCERENAAAAAVLPATSLNGSAKSGRSSEGGSGGHHPRHPYIWFLYRLLKLVFVSCYCAVDSCFRVPEEVIFSITCASCEITPE
ncbi:hypothetical protein SLE2022_256640 [Rubroshorea leprosula]